MRLLRSFLAFLSVAILIAAATGVLGPAGTDLILIVFAVLAACAAIIGRHFSVEPAFPRLLTTCAKLRFRAPPSLL